ncbi:acyl-CoA carboxylase epsilon subunit [Streptomyces sp. E11-3]|uniref:acyl-CoA carboxylase epsilon subunit n=1 Tax=Streptomyces sp. E11-3 TaxID=3110112 RepID=UPI00397F9480
MAEQTAAPLRVVRGNPEPDEIAALTAVLAHFSAARAASDSTATSTAPRPAYWPDPSGYRAPADWTAPAPRRPRPGL